MLLAGSLSTQKLSLERSIANKSTAPSQAEQLGPSGMGRCSVTPGCQQLPRIGRPSGLRKKTVDDGTGVGLRG